MYPHPNWIEIDLAQFRKNIAIVRRHIGDSLYCLPVKANAYGHGLIPMARAALLAGVDYLGVSCLQEGAELREAGIEIPILVMGAIHEDQVPDLLAFNLEFTISSLFKAQLVANHCLVRKGRVHMEVDTGMQRTGVRAKTAVELFEYLKSAKCFELIGVYSHFATADHSNDPIAQRQMAIFEELLSHPVFQGLPLITHIANSSGTTHFQRAHRHMVRPALMSLGYPPGCLEGIAPCFSLKSKVAFFKVVQAGEGISYGHTYKPQKQTRIVTVPIGYGDGYRRALSNKGSVLIRGKKYPIVGNICMDQFMVDIGDGEAYVGDEVVLIGRQGKEEISLQEIARLCDTIPYEILCGFNDRTKRDYRY